jgi:hypothetical protein
LQYAGTMMHQDATRPMYLLPQDLLVLPKGMAIRRGFGDIQSGGLQIRREHE